MGPRPSLLTGSLEQRIVCALLYPRHRAMQSLDTANERWRLQQLRESRVSGRVYCASRTPWLTFLVRKATSCAFTSGPSIVSP